MDTRPHDTDDFDESDALDDPPAGDEELEECYECGGEGFIIDECFEDSCCCEDPASDHDVIPCPVCSQKGKQ